ncbi:unnamed protein product, partial [Ectocarpus sp. 12 AP-2014]
VADGVDERRRPRAHPRAPRPNHELLDGTWSSYWSGIYNRTEEIVLPFVHTIPLMKYLWRANYLQCKTTCDFRVSWADCRCTLRAEAVAGQTPSEVCACTLPGSKHRPVEIVERVSRRAHLRGTATPHQ